MQLFMRYKAVFSATITGVTINRVETESTSHAILLKASGNYSF
jgi:hypothetical protein